MLQLLPFMHRIVTSEKKNLETTFSNAFIAPLGCLVDTDFNYTDQ